MGANAPTWMTKAFWAKGAKSPVGPLYFEGEEEAHAAWGKDALLGGAAAPAPAPAPSNPFWGIRSGGQGQDASRRSSAPRDLSLGGHIDATRFQGSTLECFFPLATVHL